MANDDGAKVKGLGRNVLSLAGGTVTAQFVSLIAIPLLTRLYSSEEFGVFSVVMSLALIVVPISTLRFNSALMVAKTESYARCLLVLSLLSVISVGIVILLLVLPWYADSNANDVYKYVIYLPLVVVLLGVVQTLQFWLLRKRKFGHVAVSQITESVFDRFVAIMLGIERSVGAAGLILGRVVGPFVNIVVMLSVIQRTSNVRRLHNISWRKLYATARRFRDFPMFSSWAFLAGGGSREAPVFLIAYFYGAGSAGLYGLGVRVLAMPILVLGDAVAKALLAMVGGHRDNHIAINVSIGKVLVLLACLGGFVVVVLAGFGEELFSYVFGYDWAEAGLYAAVLSPAIMMMLVYRVASVLYDVFEKQRQRMMFDLCLLIVRAMSLVFAGMLDLHVLDALLYMMLCTSVVYAVAMFYLLSLVGFSGVSIIRGVTLVLAMLLPTTFMVLLLYYMSFNGLWLLLSLIFVGLVQLLWMYIVRPGVLLWSVAKK